MTLVQEYVTTLVPSAVERKEEVEVLIAQSWHDGGVASSGKAGTPMAGRPLRGRPTMARSGGCTDVAVTAVKAVAMGLGFWQIPAPWGVPG